MHHSSTHIDTLPELK